MDWLKKTALVLAAIGAINWAFEMWGFNLVELLSVGWLITAVYYLVAISGVYALVKTFQ